MEKQVSFHVSIYSLAETLWRSYSVITVLLQLTCQGVGANIFPTKWLKYNWMKLAKVMPGTLVIHIMQGVLVSLHYASLEAADEGR